MKPNLNDAILKPHKLKPPPRSYTTIRNCTMIGGLRGNSELSNGFELKNDELLALLELLDAAGVRSLIFEKWYQQYGINNLSFAK